MDELGRTQRQQRTDEAMGEFSYQMAMYENETGQDSNAGNSFQQAHEYRMKKERAIADEIRGLSKDEQSMLRELCSFFDAFENKGDKKKQVVRAKEIIEELQMNVNFPALPYEETFLSRAVHHSLGMLEMLLEKGADVNRESGMLYECALDQILEEEDVGDGLSDEKKAMKRLLLSKGAKAAEERLGEAAEWARKKRNGEDDSESESEDDE
mmetsp:Transcript_3735/g.9520  ORF Transcript_3735/g.9520 Transcript_3735/m.9520 type:complete len:211 (+) Transcript_3735:142-774(+)|eukprot:CAMPEP_0181103932 /NCGR_PEP_ID=MMETSP1071-20121207/15148_1 /TAXON_ID=35127 /ORGANISM="Thalassiosira sp., Strain NH16" /LENGTH=210 /DNA_ID=CAMNT_0023187077 /DNA_START=103 /DNA_END=735 /DNA_ORIENTATION=+